MLSMNESKVRRSGDAETSGGFVSAIPSTISIVYLFAMAAPIPRDAPVMKTVFPFSKLIIVVTGVVLMR
jgi:hypothetical protein